MAAGDLLFIYEAQTGKTVVKKRTDGSVEQDPCRTGRGGIVALAKIMEVPYELVDSEPETYTDGSTRWWRYHAATDLMNASGFVPRYKVSTVLGYAAGYKFHGFGDYHSGVKKIDRSTFDQVLKLFLVASSQVDRDRVRSGVGVPRGGAGGESEAHRALKERIAANPDQELGEPGLEFLRLEWPFETGDRVDVVLRDEFGRVVVVEVELNCSRNEVAGPLQCMKYRAMTEYKLGKHSGEVRAVLAALSIHAGVERSCERHAIECRIVPPP